MTKSTEQRASPRRGRGERWLRIIWPLVALAVLLAFNLLFTPDFFRIEIKDGHFYGSLIDILDRAVPVTLLALGMTLVIATGGVDLSVGAVMAIGGAVAALAVSGGAGAAAAIALAIGAALLAGIWNGALVAAFSVPPIIATLILMVAGRGVAQLLTGGQIITFHDPVLDFLGSGHLLGIPFTVIVALGMFALTAVLVRGTALGLFIEAIGGNATASRYAGIRVRAIVMFAYAFTGICAGVAGLIAASDIQAADANSAGLYLELDAIFAVVLGGTPLTGGRFSLTGSVAGALVIQTLTTTILTRGVPVEYSLVVKAIVILIVCLLQSDLVRERIARRWVHP